MLKKLAFAMTLSLAFAGSTFAQDANDDGWSGEASLAGGKTSGNTDTEDLSLGLKLAKQGDKWAHKFDALADYGKVDGAQNKERFALGYQIDRNLNDRTYIYGNADWYSDEFGAFRNGYFVGGGLGYKVVLPEPIGWNVEAGAGYRSQKQQDYTMDVQVPDPMDATMTITQTVPVAGDRSNELALRGFSDFDFAINENVSLYNDTEVLWSESDTYIWNEVGLSAQLMGALAARVSYRVDHHTDPTPDRKKTDSALRFGVVYTME